MRKTAGIVFLVFIFIILASAFAVLKLHPMPYRDMVKEASQRHGVSEALIFAIIKTESGFDKDAVSRAGAMGLMQITPDTFDYIIEKSGAKQMDVSMLLDPKTSIDSGTFLIARHMDEFSDLKSALCAYNAGRGAVNKWLGDSRYSSDAVTLTKIPYKETRNYVKKVMFSYKIYSILI